MREIPEWAEEEYPGNNLTRHDTMMYYLTNYPDTSNSSEYYCKNVANLALCMLGGGTAVNAAQQRGMFAKRHAAAVRGACASVP
ncbi:hypothetical protein NHQ30_011289 [Ciborinia camelliae]|nr:hypothetical protein NHQ30_011289 [Ciborinia camelliae]